MHAQQWQRAQARLHHLDDAKMRRLQVGGRVGVGGRGGVPLRGLCRRVQQAGVRCARAPLCFFPPRRPPPTHYTTPPRTPRCRPWSTATAASSKPGSGCRPTRRASGGGSTGPSRSRSSAPTRSTCSTWSSMCRVSPGRPAVRGAVRGRAFNPNPPLHPPSCPRLLPCRCNVGLLCDRVPRGPRPAGGGVQEEREVSGKRRSHFSGTAAA